MTIIAALALALGALIPGPTPWSKSTIILLLTPKVQSNLHITPEQVQAIEAAFGDHLRRTPDGKPLLLRGWPAEDTLKVEAVLTEEQKKHFTEIAIQEMGGSMLLEPRIQEQLQLTPDQLAKFKNLRTEFQAEFNVAALAAAGKNGRLSISKETLDAHGEKLLNVLTKAQLARFCELAKQTFKQTGVVELNPNVGPVSGGPLPVGSRLPDFALKDAKGRTHSTKEYRGKVFVLDFWATWCVPCKELMPVLQDLHNHYREKAVAVAGVSVDTSADVPVFMKKQGHNYPVLLNGISIAAKFRVQGLPTLYIVDPKGRIIYAKMGVAPNDGDRIRAIVEKLLKARRHTKPAKRS